MVTVVQLPPQTAPKQLTAHRHVANLEEHFLAFLNQNNKSGFVGEGDDPGLGMLPYQVSDVSVLLECDNALAIVAQVALDQEITVEKFTNYAKAMRAHTSSKMGLGHCRELLARALGYKSSAGMLGLNKAMKKHMGLIPKPADDAHPNLRKHIAMENKRRKKAFVATAAIKNHRDPSSFRLKDIVRKY